jgi:Cu/Ag efflux protein CusF
MRTKYLTLLVASLFAAVNLARAQETTATERSFGGTVVETQHATAKVKKIDRKSREITLKKPDGQKVIFVAGPEVQNFDQIKKGDTVNIAYTESVSVLVTGAGAAAPSSRQTTEIQRAPRGAKPAGTMTETAEAYAVVTDIDYNKRTVTLKGPQRTETVKVGPEAKNFDKVKIGDNVYIKTVKELALAVTK